MIRSKAALAAALFLSTALVAPMAAPVSAHAQARPAMKKAAVAQVDAQAKLVQEMVDSLFSFAEPGFQEYKTMEYLTGILEKNGFTITRGVAGIPTAWTATWGEGGPLIALGSDVDCPTGLSQMPGTTELKPLVEGAPGHGEGHNSGMPLMIAAALAAKAVMEETKTPGRLMLWPGVAEELLGAKAFYVRAGVFKDVDAVLFAHVGNEFSTGWGDLGRPGLVSVEYTFHGKTAHSGAAPWEGLSALDGVELMDVAWNFRREHLPVTQRSHYVITNGGGQPNVVPGVASVWYYFRDRSFAGVRNMYTIGNEISEGVARASGTTVTRKLQGYAAPNYNNKPLAEVLHANIQAVGMPQWSEDDQAFARAVQTAHKRNLQPLRSTVEPLSTPQSRMGTDNGSSDDIGDVMWNAPTVRFIYPANIPNLIGHNALSAMAMATPIAHKGAIAGAKAVALTVLDLALSPKVIAEAKTHQTEVQYKLDTYNPVLTEADQPALHLNKQLMERIRPAMEKFYYDPGRYPTYLDQLGIKYPNLGPTAAPAGG